jgi:ABC-type multidrug transport system fused ATPase/permease subunit
MNISQPLTSLIIRLISHVDLKRRTQFLFLFIIMIISSFAEVLSIGAVIPFLGVLTSPDSFFENPLAQPFVHFFGLTEPNQLLLPFTITFCVAVLLAGFLRLLSLWVSTRLTYAVGHEISISIYQRTLYQPYQVHTSRNTSEIINGILTKTNSSISVIMMAFTSISSLIMLSFGMLALFALEPMIASLLFVGFGLLYLIITLIFKTKLIDDGKKIAVKSTRLIKSLQEGLGGIRDILIDDSQPVYYQIYRDADLPLRRSQGTINIIGGAPKFLVEAFGMVLIAGFAYFLSGSSGNFVDSIPILGAMALGAQRLLPVLQQGYAAWSSMSGGKANLVDTLILLDQPLPLYANNQEPLISTPFNQNINLNNVSFGYHKNLSLVLEDINISIPKGSRIGFIGSTGSGKSTLLDIIMGLLDPTEGSLEVDGSIITQKNNRSWQSHIAHVPQEIFLADCSIEENIAFGVLKDDINFERVKEAAKKAQIQDFIEALPKKFKTTVGERGVQLSGGQRQRIGIARALYKKADVIIFDEATSSLDTKTENIVMESIEELSQDLTLLIIAHRITTLRDCSKIIELREGKVIRTDTYENIMKTLDD